jgi:DNA-binding transcriptional MocR family regulator
MQAIQNSNQLIDMSIAIQRSDSEFLYQQVINIVREMQISGALRAGERLPSLRGLSQKLSVSIPTVRQAYAELEIQGVIEARPKSGYFMSPQALDARQPMRVKLAQKPLKVKRQTLIEEVFEAIHKPGVVPLGVANPASAHSSDKTLARIMRQVLSRAGTKAVAYGPMDGFMPLKRQLAMRYLDQGLQVNPDEVLITNGAQEALAIALQCVAKAGDVIAVESPTYFGVLELIESLGMMALEIPLCPDDGIWLEDLERAIEEHDVKACVFSSSISNPMGSFMSDEKRKMLVEILEGRNIPFIEDDVYGDLHFTEQRGTPASLYSRKGLVLSCSSFSKTAAPGYRIGWLLAGKFTAQAKLLKRALSCSSPLLNQWALSEFIASGEYDRKMSSLRNVLERQKYHMTALVLESFPKGTRVSDPQGGGVLWIELPTGNDSKTLFYTALEHNISIAPGALFSPSSKFNRCIRISYGIPWSAEVERAVRVLGSLCTQK